MLRGCFSLWDTSHPHPASLGLGKSFVGLPSQGCPTERPRLICSRQQKPHAERNLPAVDRALAHTVAFSSCTHLSRWTHQVFWSSPLILQMSLYHAAFAQRPWLIDFHHCVPVVRGDSRPSCARSPLKKCTPELGWTTSLYPHLTLHFLSEVHRIEAAGRR